MPATPGPITVRQLGSDILLTSSVRPTRTDGSPLPAGTEIRVMRMPATSSFRPGLVSERYLVQQFLSEASTIGTLQPGGAEKGGAGRLEYRDRDIASPEPTAPAAATTASTGPAAAPGFLYAIRVVEPGGKVSAMRPPVLVEIARPPAPPGALEGDAVEGEVRLRWQPAAGPGVGTAYNVYRRESSDTTDPETPINATPLLATEFVDKTFRYDTEYQYLVRSVLTGRAGVCESPAGPGFTVKPHDRFAPVAPTGIAVAVEGAQIRVYWFPNAEPDLAGYRIYRRSERESEPRPIAEVGAAESAYADAGAEPGVRYSYSVSAVDGATPPNEGPRSEERSERLPPAGQPASEETTPGGGKAPR